MMAPASRLPNIAQGYRARRGQNGHDHQAAIATGLKIGLRHDDVTGDPHQDAMAAIYQK
jgi:hypothetical protein